jgi:hypothetical protein
MTSNARVLVIGRIQAMNQKVVAQLGERGLDAVGLAGEGSFPGLDAAGFALVVLGSGIDPETRADLKQRVRDQNPDALPLDVYGPVAAEQVDAALRRRAGATSCIASLVATPVDEVWQARVVVDHPCSLRVDLYRHRERGYPEPDVVPIAAVKLDAGAHMFAVAAQALTGVLHMLVVRAGDDIEVRRLTAT